MSGVLARAACSCQTNDSPSLHCGVVVVGFHRHLSESALPDFRQGRLRVDVEIGWKSIQKCNEVGIGDVWTGSHMEDDPVRIRCSRRQMRGTAKKAQVAIARAIIDHGSQQPAVEMWAAVPFVAEVVEQFAPSTHDFLEPGLWTFDQVADVLDLLANE